eukprot:TRINITY_DN5335_c0_g1_i1.p1 TRINITY_DN5335_c0_g1~~TRINITY_DN5335_c0_g1_i1.p1  ORF type:complete len:259 (+),score=34.39 TRINITY_DN5335_c0_g1_i1:87-779(+)
MTGETFPGSFEESLKSGVLLCKLINAIKPGTIAKISTKKMAFMQMENVAAYIKASGEMGVPSRDNFMTVDLYEGKNIGQVVQNILALKRITGHGFDVKGQSPNQVNVPSSPQSGGNSGGQRVARKVQTGGAREFKAVGDIDRTGTAYVAGKGSNTKAMTCGVCTKYITSGIVNACNATWHPKCFNCKRCDKNLARVKYYEHSNKPYCDRCILIVNPQKNVRAKTADKKLW